MGEVTGVWHTLFVQPFAMEQTMSGPAVICPITTKLEDRSNLLRDQFQNVPHVCPQELGSATSSKQNIAID